MSTAIRVRWALWGEDLGTTVGVPADELRTGHVEPMRDKVHCLVPISIRQSIEHGQVVHLFPPGRATARRVERLDDLDGGQVDVVLDQRPPFARYLAVLGLVGCLRDLPDPLRRRID